MVSIIEDWDVLEEYAGEKLGFYQLLANADNGKTEIRVLTGRCGFVKEFENSNDETLKKILNYCRRHRYTKVVENSRDQEFFFK